MLLVFVMLAGCMPEQDIQLRKVRNINLTVSDGKPMLKGDMVFFNPNKVRMKLKKIDLAIFVDGKQAGLVDQKMRMEIPAEGEFTVPIEVELILKELGLLDTISTILGGKKQTVRIQGKIRGSVHGMTLSVPVDYSEEIKLKRK